MSVEKEGQEGYDYQYLGSVFVILRFLETSSVSEIFVEKIGTEDVQLILSEKTTNKKLVFDFQFKKRKYSINLGQFAKMLSKFDANSSVQNVLSKILNGNLDSFFLITDTRVRDFADNLNLFCDRQTLKHKGNPNILKKDLSVLIQDIKKQFDTSTTSKGKLKRKFIQGQTQSLTTTILKNVLSKVFILDQIREDQMISEINLMLSKHNIPTNSHREVLLEFIDLVRKSRSTLSNVLPKINDLINNFKSNLPQLDSNYIQANSESALETELKSKKILLLTGLSLCGKTQTAVSLAHKLVTDNPSIVFKSTRDFETAYEFLLHQSNENRLCILEDPLGNDINSVKYSLARKINDIIRFLPQNKLRYLIVTTSKDVLSEALFGSTVDLDDWHDLTVKDGAFLFSIWEKISQDNELSTPEINNLIKRILDDDKDDALIQPGQLIYLERHLSKLTSPTTTAIKLLANFGSVDVEKHVQKLGGDYISVMTILALSSTTVAGVTEQEIGYILNSSTEYFPGLNDDARYSTYSNLFDRNTNIEYTLPEYNQRYDLSEKILDVLGSLLQLKYIRLEKNGEYRFTHPFYENGARRLLNTIQPHKFNRLLLFCKKSIASLNIEVALTSIDCLNLMRDFHSTENQKMTDIIEVVSSGLSSTFVTVRDQSLLFLIRNFETLQEGKREELIEAIRSKNFESTIYTWNNGVPFIPNKRSINTRWGNGREYKNRDEIQTHWNEWVKVKEKLGPQEALNLLKSILILTKGTKKRVDFKVKDLVSFLKYRESFIKEIAAYLIASSCKEEDIPIIKEIFLEGNPFVNFQLLKGLIRAFPYFKSTATINDLLGFMKQAFDNQFIVLNSVELFTQFNAGHSSNSFDWRDDIEDSAIDAMWIVWAEMIPVLFKHLPKGIHINPGRFEDTLLHARVDIETISEIVIGGLDWVLKDINCSIYDNYTSIIFLTIFGRNLEKIELVKRFDIIKKFLSISNAQYKARVFRFLLSNWNDLETDEKNHVLEKVTVANDFDKIVMITTDGVPPEIQELILNGKLIENYDSEQIVNNFSEAFVMDCLVTLYCSPADSFDNGNTKVWDKVLLTISEKPTHPGYELAIKIMFDDILFERKVDDRPWQPKKIIRKAFQSQNLNAKKLILKILLEEATHTNNKKLGAYFYLVFSLVSNSEFNDFVEMIMDNIESISDNGNLSVLPPLVQKSIESNLTADWIIHYALKPGFNMDEDTYKGFASTIIFLMKENAFRTKAAINKIVNWSNENNQIFTQEELELFKNYKAQFHQKSMEQSNKLRSNNDSLFKEWPDFSDFCL